MAAPINTPVNGDIWHLSIEDLFETLPDKARLGGPGPFVINLSVSTAPIDLPPKSFGGARGALVYQVQRTEDHRPRYRLRFGPFADEDVADAMLEEVRDTYPGALTATADAEDLRAIAALQAKANSAKPSAAAPLPNAAETEVDLPAAEAPPVLQDRVAPAASAAAPVPSAPASPAAVTTPAAPAMAQKPPPTVAPAPPRLVAAAPRAAAPAARPVPPMLVARAAPRPAEATARRAPSVDSTQTVRALTVPELEDEQSMRWFVVQLSLSEEAFDSEAVPILDIFSVYRLYSVAGIDQGRIVHALRLGFFSEEVAAGAVASYLAAFYDKPTIKRVSTAERERFADQRFQPRKDIGATGKHAVIEITNERYVREKRISASSQKNK